MKQSINSGDHTMSTITKEQARQSVLELFDSISSTDEDSFFDLNLIEQYIDDLEMKVKNAAEVNMYSHYLAIEIIKELPELTGDMFGLGECDFIYELLPYAELIVSMTNEAHDNGKQFNCTFVYDAMEDIAEYFIAIVLRQQITVCAAMAYEMPDIDEFKLDVARVIEVHTD